MQLVEELSSGLSEILRRENIKMIIRKSFFAVPFVALAVACGGSQTPEAEAPEAAEGTEAAEEAEELSEETEEVSEDAAEGAEEAAAEDAAEGAEEAAE